MSPAKIPTAKITAKKNQKKDDQSKFIRLLVFELCKIIFG
jgi:preprotein translocase subunit SecE